MSNDLPDFPPPPFGGKYPPLPPADPTRCPCGCGLLIHRSLGEFVPVARETGAADMILERLVQQSTDYEVLVRLERNRLETRILHHRLVARCHGEGGLRAGAELGLDAGRWRKWFGEFIRTYYSATTDEDRTYLDWWQQVALPAWVGDGGNRVGPRPR